MRGDSISFWADKKDGVLIAEYFVVEEKEEKLYLFEGGKTEWDSNLTAARKKKAIDSRKSCRKRVVWYKIGGGGILEGPVEFPASSVPIVRMPGREWFGTASASHAERSTTPRMPRRSTTTPARSRSSGLLWLQRLRSSVTLGSSRTRSGRL